MVMKRGKKERVENLTQKLKYVPLSAENDESVLADNTVNYTTIIEQLGWLEVAGVNGGPYQQRTV